MSAQQSVRAVCSVLFALALTVLAASAQAQAQRTGPSAVAQPQAQRTSPSTVALAKELIAVKGATTMYDPVVRGAVESAKLVLLRTNPLLSKDLNEVTAKLHNEYANRIHELRDLVARIYASRFTEQELKDALAFYKTPLGKKLIEQEPQVLEDTMREAQSFGDKLSEEAMGKIRAEMKKKGHEL